VIKGRKKISETIERRKNRVRKSLRGTKDKPRMCVVKTSKHIYVQLIDDVEGKTLFAHSTKSPELVKANLGKKSKEAAKVMGESLAQKAKDAGIEAVIFDRGRFSYHGILAALADACRNSGLRL
jgi:large subunit ribosomal protein L18